MLHQNIIKQCKFVTFGLPDWHFQRVERVFEGKI